MICPRCGKPMRERADRASCPCGESYPAREGATLGEMLWASEQAYKRQISRPGGGGRTSRARKEPKKWVPPWHLE